MSADKGYGSHPTKYGALSDSALYAMYRSESWAKLGESDRQQLLQETVNRAAMEKGELGSCEVRFSDLSSNTCGYQSGNAIVLNRSMFVDDKLTHEYNGRVIEEPLHDANYRALETALHENEHAWQNQCIDGTIVCNDTKLLAEYRSNNFTTSTLTAKDGSTLLGSHYLNGVSPKTGYLTYYFQSTERDAHRLSEEKTTAIVHDITQRFGADKASLAYENHVTTNGFAATQSYGSTVFGNPNFAEEINKVLMNEYYNTNTNVDPKIDAVVKQEMVLSYDVQNNTHQLSPSQTKGAIMANNDDFYNLHVPLEKSDAQLRDSVNQFWVHAKNDPTMTKEEALRETHEMAERALTISEENHQAHEAAVAEAAKAAEAANNAYYGNANENGLNNAEAAVNAANNSTGEGPSNGTGEGPGNGPGDGPGGGPGDGSGGPGDGGGGPGGVGD